MYFYYYFYLFTLNSILNLLNYSKKLNFKLINLQIIRLKNYNFNYNVKFNILFLKN